MPRLTDWEAMPEFTDIMEKFIDRFPKVFEGFDVSQVEVWLTKNRKSKVPCSLKAVGFPCYLSMKPYVVEVHQEWWREMDAKRRNLAVFHIMCFFPDGAFDEQAKEYGKKKMPDIKMFLTEFAAAGGIPNWLENSAARDPLKDVREDELRDDGEDDDLSGEDDGEEDALPEEGTGESPDGIQRKPVSQETIANVGLEDEAAT